MIQNDENILNTNLANLTEKEIAVERENIRLNQKNFEYIFDPKLYQNLINENKKTLSQKATLNSLFILLYRDKPILHSPFTTLSLLINIDEKFTKWRSAHALLAQRMLGTKLGTGGSSGFEYLKMAAEKNRIYLDIFNLSTFLIQKSELPKLPENLNKKLNFYFKNV